MPENNPEGLWNSRKEIIPIFYKTYAVSETVLDKDVLCHHFCSL